MDNQKEVNPVASGHISWYREWREEETFSFLFTTLTLLPFVLWFWIILNSPFQSPPVSISKPSGFITWIGAFTSFLLVSMQGIRYKGTIVGDKVSCDRLPQQGEGNNVLFLQSIQSCGCTIIPSFVFWNPLVLSTWFKWVCLNEQRFPPMHQSFHVCPRNPSTFSIFLLWQGFIFLLQFVFPGIVLCSLASARQS